MLLLGRLLGANLFMQFIHEVLVALVDVCLVLLVFAVAAAVHVRAVVYV